MILARSLARAASAQPSISSRTSCSAAPLRASAACMIIILLCGKSAILARLVAGPDHAFAMGQPTTPRTNEGTGIRQAGRDFFGLAYRGIGGWAVDAALTSSESAS